ncbi:MAG: 50S ribosomal protein L6 [Alphaproteobacteria bacterium]
MSRVGNKAVAVPSGTTVTIGDGMVKAKGSKGELQVAIVDEVEVSQNDGSVVVKPLAQDKRSRAMWGMQRALIQNIVTGVSDGFEKNLEITGVGYRAAVQGKKLTLQLGYSHDIEFDIPDGIEIACERPTALKVSGIDKQQVGQVAAKIRGYRPPEPYKGKGVKYADEYIFRKEGKKK